MYLPFLFIALGLFGLGLVVSTLSPFLGGLLVGGGCITLGASVIRS